MKEYEVYQFENGIQLVHKQVNNSRIAHLGFILDVGSRDEWDNEIGIAHFWEHMAFKGTSKRKAYQIINSLENLGGELNAYTTKEKICFYASILDQYYFKAADLLADITFNSIFPEKEIEKERSVILEEMAMYADTPEDAIADEFDNLLFGNNPLGNNILGTYDTVKTFQKHSFESFLAHTIDTSRVVFSSVCNLPFATVFKKLQPIIEAIPSSKATLQRNFSKEQYSPKIQLLEKPISQSHCVMGNFAPALNTTDRLPYFMLINLLGGPAMNSKLNLVLREKHGLVYNVEANYTPFTDIGMFNIAFATEPKQLKKAIQLVNKEIVKLQQQSLSNAQLHTIKTQLKGQLAMAEESNMNFMLMLGKSLLDKEKIDSLNDVFAQIDKIEATQLLEMANKYLDLNSFSTLVYEGKGNDA